MIESHAIDPGIARQTIALILGQKLDVWVYTPEEWLIREPDAPHVARETWTVKFDAKVVPEFTNENLAHAVKIVGISDDLDRVRLAKSGRKRNWAIGQARRARSPIIST